jgi:hypothetical protein
LTRRRSMTVVPLPVRSLNWSLREIISSRLVQGKRFIEVFFVNAFFPKQFIIGCLSTVDPRITVGDVKLGLISVFSFLLFIELACIRAF